MKVKVTGYVDARNDTPQAIIDALMGYKIPVDARLKSIERSFTIANDADGVVISPIQLKFEWTEER